MAPFAIFPPDEDPPQREDTYFFITNRCNQGCAYGVTEANSYPHFDDCDLASFERELPRHPGSKASRISLSAHLLRGEGLLN